MSLVTRVIFSISFALSFLSIASLADSVYKFKGFILETVNFWREITRPILEFILQLDLPIETWQFDYWVLVSITFLPYTVVRWRSLTLADKLISSFFCMAYFIFPFLLSEKTLLLSVVFGVYLIYLVCFFGPWRTPASLLIGFRMLSPPVLVAILAAISEGIARPIV